MAVCNVCLHQDVCQMHCEEQSRNGCSECWLSICRIKAEQCPHFKDKYRYVEQKRGRWERGAIISGYQGIGKSTLANVDSGYIDLESGNFFVDGKRAEDWYIPYCQIAMHLAEQGYRVFVSSHAVVREHLASLPKSVDLYVCFPSYSLRRQWEAKLEARYNASQKDKDYRAWKNAEDRYADNIKELHETTGFIPIVIHEMSYDLGRLIDACCGAKMMPQPPKGE